MSEEGFVKKFVRDAVLAVIGGLVIEPTLSRVKFDVSPYLPQIWFGIFVFLTIDYCWRSIRIRQWATGFYADLEFRGKLMSYLVVGALGIAVFCAYWFAATSLFRKDTDKTSGAYMRSLSSDEMRSEVSDFTKTLRTINHDFDVKMENDLKRQDINAYHIDYENYEDNFRKHYLAEARTLRIDLLRRLVLPAPIIDDFHLPDDPRLTALTGSLAGAEPLERLAGYLDDLASRLQ